MRGKLFALDFVIGDNQCRLLHILPELMPLEDSSHTSRYQHHHSCFELYYITSGQCVVGSNRKRLCVSSGQLLLIPPGVYHSANSASEDASVMTLSFELRPPDNASKKTNSNRFAQAFSLSAPIILPATGSNIEYVLSQLRDITRKGNPPYIHLEKARSLCSLLLLELYELLTQTEPQLPAAPARRGLPQNYVIDIFFGHHFSKKTQALSWLKC